MKDIQTGRGPKKGLNTVQKLNAISKQPTNAPYPNFFCSCLLKLLASTPSYIILAAKNNTLGRDLKGHIQVVGFDIFEVNDHLKNQVIPF